MDAGQSVQKGADWAMTGRKLKIAYLCDQSPSEKWSYSGGNTAIFNALQKHAGDVTVLDHDWGPVEWMRRAINSAPEPVVLRARWRIHLLLSKFIAAKVQQQLEKQDFDVLFCPYSFQCLCNVSPQKKLLTVFTSDATPTIYKKSAIGSYFGSYIGVSRFFDPLILEAERKVFTSTDIVLWASEWLKSRADQLYGLDASQSLHVPWGANIKAPERGRLIFKMPLNGPLRLLLIGRDWFAKGGPLAVEILDHLVSLGVDAHLTVVGCVPPDGDRRERMTVHAYLDKNDPAEKEIFESLFLNSHFLMMPSFESYGFAFAEASAYGLPSLGLRVGGIPIWEGVNGHALPKTAGKEDFAERILFYRQNEESYFNLRASSRQQYEEGLNWDAWGRKVSEIVTERLEEKVSCAA
jgi:glycosyltransferase involved in cell wall biosynthesis